MLPAQVVNKLLQQHNQATPDVNSYATAVRELTIVTDLFRADLETMLDTLNTYPQQRTVWELRNREAKVLEAVQRLRTIHRVLLDVGI